MNAEMIARTIQLILAPVVMVTACAIMLGGLLGHYAAINDRLRIMAHERLDLLHGASGDLSTALPSADAFAGERLQQIDVQMPDLLRRHKLVRDAVLTIYCAILIFIASMFVIAFAAAVNSTWVAIVALVMFLMGTAILLWGVLLTALEVRTSHLAIQFEAQHILSLGQLTHQVLHST
jgi:hypothetical protein